MLSTGEASQATDRYYRRREQGSACNAYSAGAHVPIPVGVPNQLPAPAVPAKPIVGLTITIQNGQLLLPTNFVPTIRTLLEQRRPTRAS